MPETKKLMRRDRIVIDVIQIKKLEKQFETTVEEFELESVRYGDPLKLSNNGDILEEFHINTYVMPSDLWPHGADLLIFENAEKKLRASMVNFRGIYE